MKSFLIAPLFLALATGAQAKDVTPKSAPTSFAFEEIAKLAPAQVIGDTPLGRRQAIPITGGTFSGPGMSGQILPGGADYQLIRPDGAVLIDAEYMIETDDHVIIHVRNVGVLALPGKNTPGYAWAAPTFAAPKGPYGWLNDAIFVSHIGPADKTDGPAVKITIYKVGP